MESILRLLGSTHGPNRKGSHELIYAAYAVHLCKAAGASVLPPRVPIRVRLLYDRRLSLLDTISAENAIPKLQNTRKDKQAVNVAVWLELPVCEADGLKAAFATLKHITQQCESLASFSLLGIADLSNCFCLASCLSCIIREPSLCPGSSCHVSVSFDVNGNPPKKTF